MADKGKSKDDKFFGIDDSKLDEEWDAIVKKAMEIAKEQAGKGKK